MLIVAKQDDEKFAIWNTVTDEFVGVNLSKDDAVLEIMADRCCTRETALSRVEHPQPFSDIARLIDDGDEECCDLCEEIIKTDDEYFEKRVEGGDFIFQDKEGIHILIDTGDSGCLGCLNKINYCPKCGRKLVE